MINHQPVQEHSDGIITHDRFLLSENPIPFSLGAASGAIAVTIAVYSSGAYTRDTSVHVATAWMTGARFPM